MRLLAEGVAGPARICNAGAGCWDTKVAPRGRGGQGDGAGSLSRIFTATVRPQGTPLRNGTHKGRPYGCLGPNPAWGQGFRAAGSIARAGLKPAPTVCEGSTHVRIIQEGWRNCGIWADWWGRNGADVVKRWDVCGIGWGSAGERVAQESDVFFGCGGASGSGVGEVVSAGVCVGASGGHWLSNMANARRWP